MNKKVLVIPEDYADSQNFKNAFDPASQPAIKAFVKEWSDPGALLASFEATPRLRKETKRICDVRDIQTYWQQYIDLPKEIKAKSFRVLILDVPKEKDEKTNT